MPAKTTSSTSCQATSALADAGKALAGHRQSELTTIGSHLAEQRRTIDGGTFVTAVVKDVTAAELRALAIAVLRHLPANIATGVILAAATDGKAHITAAINDQLHVRAFKHATCWSKRPR